MPLEADDFALFVHQHRLRVGARRPAGGKSEYGHICSVKPRLSLDQMQLHRGHQGAVNDADAFRTRERRPRSQAVLRVPNWNRPAEIGDRSGSFGVSRLGQQSKNAKSVPAEPTAIQRSEFVMRPLLAAQARARRAAVGSGGMEMDQDRRTVKKMTDAICLLPFILRWGRSRRPPNFAIDGG